MTRETRSDARERKCNVCENHFIAGESNVGGEKSLTGVVSPVREHR